MTGVTTQTIATFDAPWAMEFLRDGRFLVSEQDSRTQDSGKLWVVSTTGAKVEVTGLPPNTGILDIKLDPAFASNGMIYVSFLEPGGPNEPRVGRNAADMTRVPEGLAVFRAHLSPGGATASVDNVQIIWRQTPKIVSNPGSGEPGGPITFSPDGQYLFIAAGDRQEFLPAQDHANTIGKIVRIFPDGTIPRDNPFVGVNGYLPEIWTLGHRNPYGLAFDSAGQLWEHEMGPQGGDEFNPILSGGNYGWPLASNGRNYSAATDDIPDHTPGDGFVAPAVFWDPNPAPSGLIFYSGTLFGAWRGNALLGALAGKEVIRIGVSGTTASIKQTVALPSRVRDIEQASDGSLWVIYDRPDGAVVKLTPILAP